jgi:competence ComEA-like helix-hairpin-helix protein
VSEENKITSVCETGENAMKKYCTIFTLFIMVFIAGSAAYATEIYDGQLNLNTATFEELMQLPYMNMELAKAILDFRNSNGPFNAINELLSVEGIDKRTLEQMKSHLKLEGPTDLVRYEV